MKHRGTRQLPEADEIFLDHVGHFVGDVEAARSALERAGFQPTPISIQKNEGRLSGTGNVCAMLEAGYIEVLFKTADTDIGRELDSARARYEGVHLTAFSVTDASAAHRRLGAADFRVRPIVELKRPVSTGSGEAEAAFTVARVERGEMPEGRVQILTHHTECAVWQKHWLNHPNGARGLLDIVIAVGDVEEAAQRFARFLNRPLALSPFGRAVAVDRGGVQLMNAENFTRLAPEISLPAPPFIGLYGIRVEELLRADSAIRQGGLRATRRGECLIVPLPYALGRGAWVFVEDAAHLPWRL